MAFYTAEAGRGYVVRSPTLYGSSNITVGSSVSYPDSGNASARYTLSSDQSFNGDVAYISSNPVPRGTGFEAGKYRAHTYTMTCMGYGPASAECEIQAGFYRIGF